MQNFTDVPLTNCLDILELFSFTYPTKNIAPIYKAIAKELGLQTDIEVDDELINHIIIKDYLIKEIKNFGQKTKKMALPLMAFMCRCGWNFAPLLEYELCEELELFEKQTMEQLSYTLRSWRYLEEWQETERDSDSGFEEIFLDETEEFVDELLLRKNEIRKQQRSYAIACRHIFTEKQTEDIPQILLAEAGTGTGKTLGYLAPTILWSKKNNKQVWISTYSRNLQKQLNEELNDIFASNKELKDIKHIIRKGRENYICLLNYEDTINNALSEKSSRQPLWTLGFIARWLQETSAGDLIGGDFPAWLTGLFQQNIMLGFFDYKGGCIHNSCSQYKKCFIEANKKATLGADIVIANHAFIFNYMGSQDIFDAQRQITHLIFDEGHHLFDAADQSFSYQLTLRNCYDVRKWVEGNKRNKKMRLQKGIRSRLDNIELTDKLDELIADIERQIKVLPASLLLSHDSKMRESHIIDFFEQLKRVVISRNNHTDTYYDLEAACYPIGDSFKQSMQVVYEGMQELKESVLNLLNYISTELEQASDDSIFATKAKESLYRQITRHLLLPVKSWCFILDYLIQEQTSSEYITWYGLQRQNGKNYDVGIYFHFTDPTKPLSEYIYKPLSGVLITSATLRDNPYESSNDLMSWNGAIQRSGTHWLQDKPALFSIISPFNYANQLKVMIINDINKNSISQLANAYYQLFLANGGAALGLFTSIQRLLQVYNHIYEPLAKKNISLYSQHKNNIDLSSLLQIFKIEESSCLLGTDATRDGIDVPGDSLKLLVYDRVPWARNNTLHKSRRQVYGRQTYDDRHVITNIRQAAGRLIRTKDDMGTFVCLDNAFPSRFFSAFAEGTPIERLSLQEAIDKIAK